MKYFDDNGNFKPEIKGFSESCFQRNILVWNEYSDDYTLSRDVWNEVTENWKQSPADSDIVTVYWVSVAASKTYNECSEYTILRRIFIEKENSYKPFYIFISKTDDIKDFSWMDICLAKTNNSAVYVALNKLGTKRGWLLENYNDKVDYTPKLRSLLLEDYDKLTNVCINVYDQKPSWYVEMLSKIDF